MHPRALPAGLGLAVLPLAAAAGPVSSWSPAAAVVRTPNAGTDPQVALDAAGNARVVWRESLNGVTEIAYAGNVGGPWTTAYLTSNSPHPCFFPDVAVDGSTVHVVWHTNPTQSLAQIFYRRNTGGGWENARVISGTLDSRAPAVAARAGVGPCVVWYVTDVTGDADIYFSEWNGAAFIAPLDISPGTANGGKYGSVYPNVVISPNGDVTVAWPESLSGAYHINARRRVGGTWQARQELSTAATGPMMPGLAAGADNRVHVAYHDQTGAIRYQVWNGSSWSAAATLPAGGGDTRASVAVDDGGTAHVVSDDGTDVFYSNNASGSWSAWANLSKNAASQSKNSDIAFGGGWVVAVWNDNASGNPDILYTAGQPAAAGGGTTTGGTTTGGTTTGGTTTGGTTTGGTTGGSTTGGSTTGGTTGGSTTGGSTTGGTTGGSTTGGSTSGGTSSGGTSGDTGGAARGGGGGGCWAGASASTSGAAAWLLGALAGAAGARLARRRARSA